MEHTSMIPFLKWPGGKGRHAQRILRECFGGFNLPVDLYVEPFVGAGATLLAAVTVGAAKQYVGADLNGELINAWARVRSDSATLLEEYKGVIAKYKKAPDAEKFFYECRDCNEHAKGAARLIFLNSTTFNGLYRVNQSGGCNMPYGNGEKKGLEVPISAIEKIAVGLAGIDVRFVEWSFERTFERAIERAEKGERVVLYADPPYGSVSEPTKAFVAYTPQGFDVDKQRTLLTWIERAVKARVRVVVTNGGYEGNASAYRKAGLGVVTLYEVRTINSDGEGRGSVPCLLCYGGGRYA